MIRKTTIVLFKFLMIVIFCFNVLQAAEKNVTENSDSSKLNKQDVPTFNQNVITPSSNANTHHSPKNTRGEIKPSSAPSLDPGSNALPVPGGGHGVPPRGAADEIRDAAASRTSRPRITGFNGYLGCVDASSSATNILHIRGTRFGDVQGTRRVEIVLPIRHTRVRVGYVNSWSNNEIVIQLPNTRDDYRKGQPYQVVISDNSGSILSNYSDSYEVCRTEHRVSGEVELDNCNANASQMTVVAEGGEFDRRYTVQPVGSTHSDFGFSYEFDDLPQGDYTISIAMRASSCSGGTWLPSERNLSLSHRNASATANFHFSVSMESVPVPITLVRGLLNDMLQGTWIHINNYPAERVIPDDASLAVRAFLLAMQDSVIRLPEAAGGFETNFNMPVFSNDPFIYYVNNVNINSIEVLSDTAGLKIRMQFETGGVELIKECHDNVLCGLAGDIEMDLSVDVYFSLVRYVPSSRGTPGISIGDIRVVATPNAQMSGFLCSGADLCDKIVSYKSRMKRAIEEGVRTALDTRRVKNSIYTALRPTLDAFSIGNVESITVDEPNFVIRHTPEAL